MTNLDSAKTVAFVSDGSMWTLASRTGTGKAFRIQGTSIFVQPEELLREGVTVKVLEEFPSVAERVGKATVFRARDKFALDILRVWVLRDSGYWGAVNITMGAINPKDQFSMERLENIVDAETVEVLE